MTFLSPWWLLLLLPVAALVGAYLLAQRRRRRYAVRFASLPLLDAVAPARPGWRRHAPAVAFSLALALLALAAARPEASIRVPHERATVVVALDTSRSMEAEDVAPNRLDAARAAAETFVENLPDSFNVGVVVFSGTATVLVEPTTDHDAVAARLQDLTLGSATAIGDAVVTSLDVIERTTRPEPTDPADETAAQAEPVPGRVVLLSDGTNTRGRTPEEAAAAAEAAGVPVSTIAYGTPGGVITSGSRTVPVPVDEDALTGLADGSGGQAYTAASGDELAAVYEDIGSSIGWRTEDRELTPYLAALAALLLTVTGVMSIRWFARLP
ncbi:VWA domain-containing protein [Phycicoccus flavus]|uniref:VWA domain-containing protein n=1 Tax=Phycicoccus flavus TaxID=2502783 RepID=UPI000FEBD736|nr:VWA domain-containing protein [Phycicoccus flavus]NHA66462.1 VWA domain-containing protein [Phycicoccus flavus]